MAKSRTGPPEEDDLVTVSVAARRLLTAAEYLDLTGLTIEGDTIDAVVTATRATRAPKKRAHRMDCQRITFSGRVGVRGDIQFRETVLPVREAYDVAASLLMPVRGSLKLGNAVIAPQ